MKILYVVCNHSQDPFDDEYTSKNKITKLISGWETVKQDWKCAIDVGNYTACLLHRFEYDDEAITMTLKDTFKYSKVKAKPRIINAKKQSSEEILVQMLEELAKEDEELE
jgi:hypothetical protein